MKYEINEKFVRIDPGWKEADPYSIYEGDIMRNEHQIIAQVYEAKEDLQAADDLIRVYTPFIRAEVSRFISRVCTEQDDEYSIGLIAFHEAIQAYSKNRGAFLSYASMLIKSRLIDYQRKEKRHMGHISLDEEDKEEGTSLKDQIADQRDRYEESAKLQATKQEIAELAKVMAEFGVSFTDVAENSPKQERTLEVCKRAVRYAAAHKEILEELLRTKKLPMGQLVKETGVERKTMERHRKYILVMLLIQTNGYEMIRGHLRHILKEKGGMPT